MVMPREAEIDAAFAQLNSSPCMALVGVGAFAGLEQGAWLEDLTLELARQEAGRGRNVICLYDTSHATRTRPEMRRFWSELSKRSGDEMRRLLLGTIVVITNPLMRGVMTAVAWLDPRVAQAEVRESMPRALERAKQILEGHGRGDELTISQYFTPDVPKGQTG